MFDTENQLIRVQFGSSSTIADWKRALVQIQRLSEETGICRLLVDVRKQTDMGDTDALFDFVSQLPRSIAYAVLCEIHLDIHRFIENISIVKGINVKDFYSEHNAIAWLKHWLNKNIDNKS